MSEEKEKVESVRAAFASAFAPYTDLKLDGLSLEDVEAKLREVGELKVRHTGKKSAIAETMKLIGRLPAEDRGAFGQLAQSVEKEIASAIDNAESKL